MDTQPDFTRSYDTSHVEQIIEDKTAAITALSDRAYELGLEKYGEDIRKDAWQARVLAGTAYLADLLHGPIEDEAFAATLAAVEAPYIDAIQSVSSLSIDNAVKESMLDKLASDSAKLQASEVAAYKAFMKDFIHERATPEGMIVPEKLDELSAPEIQQAYDTTPVNKRDFRLSGSTIHQAGRTWNLLVDYAKRYKETVTRGGDSVKNEDPRLRFGETGPVHYINRDTCADLDFVDLYTLAQWAEQKVAENSNTEYKDLLGHGAGPGSMRAMRQLIALRKLPENGADIITHDESTAKVEDKFTNKSHQTDDL